MQDKGRAGLNGFFSTKMLHWHFERALSLVDVDYKGFPWSSFHWNRCKRWKQDWGRKVVQRCQKVWQLYETMTKDTKQLWAVRHERGRIRNSESGAAPVKLTSKKVLRLQNVLGKMNDQLAKSSFQWKVHFHSFSTSRPLQLYNVLSFEISVRHHAVLATVACIERLLLECAGKPSFVISGGVFNIFVAY